MGASSTTAKGGATTIAVPVPPPADTRKSTIVVAASNSLDPTLAPAAYRCSGANDEVEINAALTAAVAAGGEVSLLEGLFVTAAPIVFPGNSLVLSGLGRATIIRPAAAAGNAINVSGRDDVIIRDLAIDTKTSASGGHCIFIEDGSDRFLIDNVWIIDSDNNGIHVEGTTIDTGHIQGCHILDTDVNGIYVDMDNGNYIYRLHIIDCDIRNCGARGIYIQPSAGNTYCEIVNNGLYANGNDGIVFTYGYYSIIKGNRVIGNTNNGIEVNTCAHVQVTENTCSGNTHEGIYNYSSPEDDLIGNICVGNGFNGIHVYAAASLNCTITGNVCCGNTQNGITLTGAHDNKVGGNTCNVNIQRGIFLDAASKNTLTGNTCSGNDANNTGTFDGINLNDSSDDNLVMDNTCNDNDRYGIRIDDAVGDRNWVKNNHLRGNTAGPFNDRGTNTKLETKTFQFTELVGQASWQTVSPTGILVDADSEGALAEGWVPLEAQMVVRFRIAGVTLGAPGAGNAMLLEIIINSGKPTGHEAYNAEAINVVNKVNTEVNPAVNDAVEWVIDASDDADVDDIEFGETFECFAMYEAAVAPNIATNAVIRTVSVEYV